MNKVLFAPFAVMDAISGPNPSKTAEYQHAVTAAYPGPGSSTPPSQAAKAKIDSMNKTFSTRRKMAQWGVPVGLTAIGFVVGGPIGAGLMLAWSTLPGYLGFSK